MEDEKIIDLFFCRSEQAVSELSNKYGRLCSHIAIRILSNKEDAEECENDTWLRVWNSIPPTRPQILSAYVAKIVRNLALSRLQYNTRKKRHAPIELLFSELEECLPDSTNVEAAADDTVQQSINDFLNHLDDQTRILFIRRYFCAENVRELAQRFSLKESSVSTKLNRVRQQLKKHLEQEGIVI